MKKRLEAQDNEISKLQGQLAQLSTSLSEAQTENKTLSTKLAANRAAAASVESINKKAPGSAVKAAGTIRLMGSAEVAETAQAAQLKENLYSDLTGLIIRSVKREDEEDVFDCIQTGRNGSKSRTLIHIACLFTDLSSASLQIWCSERQSYGCRRRCPMPICSSIRSKQRQGFEGVAPGLPDRRAYVPETTSRQILCPCN